MSSQLNMNTSKIASIELVGEDDLMDISVDGDHFFMANDMLVKNSYGIPMSLDALVAIIQSEEMYQEGKYYNKVLKTRFDGNVNSVYTVGVDRNHMKLFDVSEEEKSIPMIHQKKFQDADAKRTMNEDLDDDGDSRGWVYDDDLAL